MDQIYLIMAKLISWCFCSVFARNFSKCAVRDSQHEALQQYRPSCPYHQRRILSPWWPRPGRTTRWYDDCGQEVWRGYRSSGGQGLWKTCQREVIWDYINAECLIFPVLLFSVILENNKYSEWYSLVVTLGGWWLSWVTEPVWNRFGVVLTLLAVFSHNLHSDYSATSIRQLCVSMPLAVSHHMMILCSLTLRLLKIQLLTNTAVRASIKSWT